MFERFTDPGQRVLVQAQEKARLLDHHFVGTAHLLLGLLHEEDGPAARALESLDGSLEAACQNIRRTSRHVNAGPGH